jgi:hypothetical protein
MSCLQGTINVTYGELVKIFGIPNCETDGYKTDAEWRLEIDDEEIYIYNWKNGKNYCGKDGLAVEDITDWHIGGGSPVAVELIKQEIQLFESGGKR